MLELYQETLDKAKEKEFDKFNTPEECLKFMQENFTNYFIAINNAEDTIISVKVGGEKMTQEEYTNIIETGIDACDKADEFAEKYIGKKIFDIDKTNKYSDFYDKSSKLVMETLIEAKKIIAERAKQAKKETL